MRPLENSRGRHRRNGLLGHARCNSSDADGPLARVDVHVRARGKAPLSDGRLRQHYATSERFDDEADLSIVMQEAETYYANIIMPYGKAVVLSCLERIAGMEIRMIAPSHGLIWRSHGAEIIEAYRRGRTTGRSPRCW